MNKSYKALLYSLIFMVVTYQPSAHALALHEMELKSKLNQQLNVIIPLSATDDELNTLNLIIERPEGIDLSTYWPEVQAKVVRNEKGNHYIVLTSEDVIREPVMGFVLDLNWSTGRILREYSLIIDI